MSCGAQAIIKIPNTTFDIRSESMQTNYNGSFGLLPTPYPGMLMLPSITGYFL